MWAWGGVRVEVRVRTRGGVRVGVRDGVTVGLRVGVGPGVRGKVSWDKGERIRVYREGGWESQRVRVQFVFYDMRNVLILPSPKIPFHIGIFVIFIRMIIDLQFGN